MHIARLIEGSEFVEKLLHRGVQLIASALKVAQLNKSELTMRVLFAAAECAPMGAALPVGIAARGGVAND